MSGDIEISVPDGDPQALLQLANQLDQHATSVGNLGANALRTTQAVKSAADWTGPASSAYTTFTGDVSHGVTNFEPPLHRVANSIRTYAGVLKSAQDRVTGAVGTADNAVKTKAADAQTHVAAAQQAATEGHAEVQKAGDQAATEIAGEKSAFEEFMEKLKPWEDANEWVHLPLDVTASDAWLDTALEKWKDTAEKGVTAAKQARADLDGTLEQAFDDQVGSVAHDFDNGLTEMGDVDNAFAKYAETAKTATQAADAAVDSAETGANIAKTVGAASKVMGGLAIAGDVMTIVHPEDKGAMGTVDRVVAAGNLAGTATALLAVNASADWIPGVGEAVAAGTGLFLAGKFLYDVKPIHDFVNNVGSGIASGFSKATHWVGNLL